MSGTPRQILVRYTVAVAAVIIVTILKKIVINSLVGDQQWFLLYVAAISLSSWYGGFGPGIVTATLSALAAALLFTSPNNNLAEPSSLFQLMLFLLEGLLVVGLTGNLRENRMAAEKDEREKDEALAMLDSFQVYAPVGLAFLDNDLRYLRINYAMAELDGLTPAAHIGRTLQEVQPNMKPDLISGIQEVLNTGKPLLDQEHTVVKPTMLGMKKQYLMTSYYRIRGLDGQPLGVGAVMVDMTQYKQSEEAVRESEARFRTMADTAPVMIWLAEPNKLRTYFNKVWFDFTGRTEAQDYGNGWTENLHPDDVKSYLEVYTTAFDARQEFNTEYRLRRKDGEYRWLISHGVPRFTPEGQFAGYIGISIDITERKRLQIAQEFVLQTGVLLSSTLDYTTTLGNITQLAVPAMADWCAVDILSPDGGTLERIAVAHVDPEKVKWAYELQKRYPVNLNAETGVAGVIRRGKTEFTPEITEAMIEGAATDAEMYQILVAIGFTSVITAPLTARGRTIGALTLVSAESKRHYTETDVKTAEQLAVRIALAVDNAHLFREAQAERERFRTTLASIGDAVIATDHAGQITFINQVAANLTGWSSSDALGTSLDHVFKIVNEQTRATVESPVDKVLREGRVVGMANHTVLISKSGQETPIDDSGAPIPGENGEIGGVVLVFRDVSERKREEERQQFLVEASELLSSSLDYETTLSSIVKLAAPTIADWSAIDLLTPEGEIQRVAVAHVDPEKVQWAYEIQKRFPPHLTDANGVGRVLSTGETEFVADVPALIAPIYDALPDEMKQVLDTLQSVSVITTPLKVRGIIIGVLSFSTSADESERRYTQTDVQLAETLALRAAVAVDNARLYSEAQAERERFRVTLASIGDAVIATNHEGEVTFLNQIAANLTGWSQDEAIGTPLSGIFNIVNEQTRQTVENPVDRVLQEGRIVGLANHTLLISKSGEETPIDDSGSPIPGEDGEIGGVVLVFRDVSERKQEERRQQFLTDATSLLGTSLDYETTLTNLVDFAVPAIADWCAVDLVTDDGKIERLAVAHVDPEKAKLAFELSRLNSRTMDTDGNLQRVIRSGKTDFVPVATEEILRGEAMSSAAYELIVSLNPKSYMLVPLTARGHAIGTFSLVYTESGRIYTENDVAMIEQLANRAGLAVENAHLFREAQAERERFRVTLASIGDAVIATNHEGEVTFLNQIASDLTGWSSDDAIGAPLSSVFQIINEQTRETVASPVDRVLQEGRIVGLANHTLLISKSGEETPIDDSGSPIPGDNGEIGGVVLVFRDVSERKRTDRRQQFLTEASKILISSLDYEATLQHVTQLAVPMIADWCAVYLAQEDGSIEQVAFTHIDPERAKLREELMRRYPLPQSRDYGYPKVIRTGEPELLENVSDEILQAAATNAEHLELLRKSSYQSSICVPLKNLEQTFGALTFNSLRGGRAFNGDDLALAEELARIASLAIENARLYRQARGNN